MIEAPETDRQVGMDAYATDGEPCPALLKQNDEDFSVEERLLTEGMVSTWKSGYFPLYRVEKHHIDTLHMERELSMILRSKLSFGGLKDKRSVSVQFVTPTSTHAERPERVETPLFRAEVIGYLPSPLRRGRVVGNAFVVILRDCCPQLPSRTADAFSAASQKRVPNYFGLQRFGVAGPGTHRVGKAVIFRDFKRAVELILTEPRPNDDANARDARVAIREGKYAEGIGLLPSGQDVEILVARCLERKPGDWVGAIRSVPLRLRRLYVQAYQSFIFNKTLSLAIRSGEDISRVANGDNWSEPAGFRDTADYRVHGVKENPLPGGMPMVQLVGYAFRDYGSRFDRLIKEVMREEGVSAKDFYIQELQEASAEGGFRRPHILMTDADFRHLGTSSRVSFALGKGEYATVLLREIVKPRDPMASGFA